MTRNFVLKGIVLPLAAALLTLLATFTVFRSNAAAYFPVLNHAQLAYHDELEPSDALVRLSDGTPERNALIGTLNGNGSLDLRYAADTSLLLEAASLNEGSALPGTSGCLYVKIIGSNVGKITTGQPLVISTADGEYTYQFVKEQLCESELAVLHTAPAEPKSLIVYYRVSNGIGLTTNYYALIYKEVA